jgi:hypothetical protein
MVLQTTGPLHCLARSREKSLRPLFHKRKGQNKITEYLAYRKYGEFKKYGNNTNKPNRNALKKELKKD